MKIVKAINNNVVSARDINGREVVVMGKGIGFKVTAGIELCEDKIEKIFYKQNVADIYSELFTNIPKKHIHITNEIINYAKTMLNKKLNQNIYITLADHINFAIQRYNQGMNFRNPLLWEIQNFYIQEYLVGEYAIEIIRNQLGVSFSDDEAASVAMHIINAQYDTTMGDAMNIAKLIPAILEVVRDYLKIDIVNGTQHYDRFITHLKFFAQRVVKKESIDKKDTEFNEMIKKLYPEEFNCSEKIASYIEKHYDNQITGEELAYLTVYIALVRLAER